MLRGLTQDKIGRIYNTAWKNVSRIVMGIFAIDILLLLLVVVVVEV